MNVHHQHVFSGTLLFVLNFVLKQKNLKFALRNGGVAEWSMAAVLKTVERQRSGGSNPSASAQCNASQVPHVSAAFVFDGLSVKRLRW